MPYPRWTSPSPAWTREHGVELRARQASTNTCLPQSLVSAVSSCALNCIVSFATVNYPGATCGNTTDLNYLCTQPNTSGLTIGEGSVQCIVSFCTGQDELDVDAYNICNGIANAQPNTVRTITATIFGSSPTTSSTMNTLPATIGNPTSTEDISTIVMATDSPTWMIVASTSASSSSTADASVSASMPAGPDGTSGAMAMPEKGASNRGLTTPQIVGIAVGGAATVIILAGLVMLLFWMRKLRKARRRSQRRSRFVEQSPPPNYQSPLSEALPTFDNIGSFLAAPSPSGRFYGGQPTTEEKRRSFWRKSIKPEEIGVAVSPKIPGDASPGSASSEQSFSLLLPSVPAAALRPAPLNLEATKDRRRFTQRPVSSATEFDEEPDVGIQKPEKILVDNQPFILEKPPLAKRPRGPPPNLKLPMVPESPPPSTSQARIPLTPTYDNGNVDFRSPPRSIRSPPGSHGPLLAPERKLPPTSIYANRNAMRKNAPSSLPLRAVTSPPVEPLLQPRSAPQPPRAPSAVATTMAARSERPAMRRQSTVSSIYTDIEEDTTPEEIYKQLGLRANPPTPSIIPTNVRGVSPGQESPIKDLRYPQIPRSAAVSRQAEKPAQLRASRENVLPLTQAPFTALPKRPRRDDLVRAEASFMQTDTTSSDGYMSDSTIEFPFPPTSTTRTSSLVAQLRSNPSSGNRGPLSKAATTFFSDASPAETKTVEVPQRSPSTKARLTPSKSSTGDLYLTVEI
ncbi:hypothetical protein H2200_002466 [Cladophialophora chaetospira]|uniref:Extracellular membrane protein CFEM domain-containing protein n=1 Tax=Cladophialophora chaetospira TaxID=386627 RepID=A0AA39CNK9_9EURO|nr:hypothetical protein H2200_002466 [Cladophialophora chaetospira]